MTFTENVVVTGAPTLPITIGGIVRQAAWNGRGSGSNALVFTTPVQSGDAAPTGVRIAGPLGLSGGAAIRDRAGNALIAAASGTFPRVAVDAVGPSVATFGTIAVTPRRVSLAVTFTEPVNVTGRPSIPFTLAGVQRQLAYVSGSGSNGMAFSYTPSIREVPTNSNVAFPTQAIGLNGGAITDRVRNAAISLAKPTDVALSTATVAENQPSGTTVGTISTTDRDARDTFTYSLVSGDGSTDNAVFGLSGNRLWATSSLDFETKNVYSVRVRSTDQGGLSTDKAFTITVTNAAEAPTDISLSNASLAENAGENAIVGTFSSTDPDADSTFTYSLVTGTGSADNLSFNIVENQLRATASLDFEAQSSYSVRVRSTDQSSLFFEKVFAVTATDVNESPTDIAISSSTIAENSGPNAVIGTLTTTDPDKSDTFTYALVSGDGSTDNAAFNISGNQLRANLSLDFETKTSYAVRVRSTDPHGLFVERSLAILVGDVDDVVIQFVQVGDAGNEADSSGFGDVSYEYQIGKYEVTIGQYVTFLNAVAQADWYSLYSTNMAAIRSIAGVTRSRTDGRFIYTVTGPSGVTPSGADSPDNRPIAQVSWYDAARFANWMSNGQPTGAQGPTTTENGAYNLNGALSGVAPALNAINPNTGAAPLYRIPTEDEWFKAAYYKGSGQSAGYWDYATQSNQPPGNTIGSESNQANWYSTYYTGYSVTGTGDFSISQNYLTNVGAYSGSPSAYGTFDQTGNVNEWTASSGLRGGYFAHQNSYFVSARYRQSFDPSVEFNAFGGFRLASPVSAP